MANRVRYVSTSRPKARREDILDAAAELFAKRDFNSVSVDEIAANVGMTGPALYRHFSGKESILAEILAATTDLLITTIRTDNRVMLAEIVARTVDVALISSHAFHVWNDESNWQVTLPSSVVASRACYRHTWEQLFAAAPNFPSYGEPALVRDVGLAIVDSLVHDPNSAVGRPVRPLAIHGTLTGLNALLLAMSKTETETTTHAAVDERTKQSKPRAEVILHTALQLFRSSGFAPTTMKQIGTACGTTASNLYRYFESKEAILGALCDLHTEHLSSLMGSIVALDHRHAFTGIVQNYVTAATANPDLVAVVTRERHRIPLRNTERLRSMEAIRDKIWSEALTTQHPTVTGDQVALAVTAGVAMIHHFLLLQRPQALVHAAAIAAATTSGICSRTPD